MSLRPILIAGTWRKADAVDSFHATNPQTKERLADDYPVSSWNDCNDALNAAVTAAESMRALPSETIARFLEDYADRIESQSESLVEMAHSETALPKSPRLADVELPRTTGQIRQAAQATRDGSWRAPIIDTQLDIRSCYGPLGPVCVFGPNNFPFAFNSISGGDFASAIAAGNPVIAKANSSHPGTTRLFAELAEAAEQHVGMPAGTVQLLYRMRHDEGLKLVADPRVGATGYTGSRSAGLALKSAADRAGNPIYLELSSINPVVILPGAIRERLAELADEFATSCLMGTGQFCTNPGLVILLKGIESDSFISTVGEKFSTAAVGTLLSEGVEQSLARNLEDLLKSGADLVVGNTPGGGAGFSHANTLLKVDADTFLENPESLQTEAFGNCSLMLVANDIGQACEVVKRLEGNLTGCVYSSREGEDDADYDRLVPHLRQRVGRLLNDKMPTGVAVSAAMNHGGPYPATSHPGFTAVGMPASLTRFAALHCYDNVRQHRLPECLRDENPGKTWRFMDGNWTI